MPFTRCRRPTLTIRGRSRRSRGSDPIRARSSRSARPRFGAASVGRRLGDRVIDRGQVDALRHDRVPLGMCREVDADEASHVLLQARPGEEHGVGGVRREALHQARPEPEVLGEVDPAERRARERARPVQGFDHGVRVGGDREDDRYPEFARDIRCRQAADVGHPQVQQVDAAGGTQHAPDAAAGHHAQRPRGRGRHGVAEQRDAAVDVPVLRVADARGGRPWPRAPTRATG